MMRAEIVPGQRILYSEDDPDFAMVWDGHPSWVRLPRELGVGRVAVEAIEHMRCPCGRHATQVFVLAARGLRVAECVLRGEWLWFTERNTE